MTSPLYAASASVYQQMLGALSKILAMAQVHAAAKKIDPSVLIQGRLYPDMLPLARQVQIACDHAKGSCARLSGTEVPAYADDETTFEQLQARIAKTLAFIATIAAAQFEGSAERAITIMPGTQWERSFAGAAYLHHYALPNFYFHLTTAYAILRHNGVEIGKGHFLGAK
jgi:hypothetical protein